MTKNAQIIKINDNDITVRLGTLETCKGCNCLFKGYGDITIKNSQDAQVGDIVVINIPDSNLLMANFLMFGLPLFALAVGLFVGSFFNIIIQVILMFGLMTLSIIILYYLDNNLKNKVKFSMTLLKILDKSEMSTYSCQSIC
jgi:sigma-E factor negative regulatory protein RseC